MDSFKKDFYLLQEIVGEDLLSHSKIKATAMEDKHIGHIDRDFAVVVAES